MKEYLKPEISYMSFETEAVTVLNPSLGIEEGGIIEGGNGTVD